MSALTAAIVPLIASIIIGLVFLPGSWYRCLNKSRLSPDGWVFGVVWTILYPLIGVAMVAACYGTDSPWTWILPVLNILVSLLFAPVMFGQKSTTGGAMITSFSLLLGIGCIIQFSVANKSVLAAFLMIPYVLWLLLATYLAWYVWVKNPGARTSLCDKRSAPVRDSDRRTPCSATW